VNRFLHPTADEVVLGVHGPSARPLRPGREGGSPRNALEAELAAELQRNPVFVSFSGGRDSSAVLATAMHVSRTRELPPPRPVILRYPGDVDADETAWQELVLDHLGIDDPVIVEIVDRMTYLDRGVRANLRRRGLILPAALQLDHPVLRTAADATLLTGEGGDEILGPRRITPHALLLRLHRRPARSLLGWAGAETAPARARARREVRTLATSMSWLKPEAVRRAHRALLLGERRRPLHWGRETLSIGSARISEVLTHNYQVIADEFGTRVRHPLLAPAFVEALAAAGGRWGYAGRTALMRELFSDLLPDALLARTTKASFGGVRWGEIEREFARSWDGRGLPEELIDAEAIRAEWLSPHPSGASVPALHAAWLHSQGLSWEGEDVA
jgi:asparagine synthase (glutamine-hydrolysing)